MLYTIFRTAAFLLAYSLCLVLGWLMAYLTGMKIILSILVIHGLCTIAVAIRDKISYYIEFFLLPGLILNTFLMLSFFMIEHLWGDIIFEKIHLASGDYRKTYMAEKSRGYLILTGPTKNKVQVRFQEKKWNARVRGNLIFLENGDQLRYYTKNRPSNKAGYGIKMEFLIGTIDGDSIRHKSETLYEYTPDGSIYPEGPM
ncbi:MAG: hypothetical protein HUU34_05655 [Saprospiraceae bacterium]|jgi:hypothetical protein|nr:hypothetical protein [Saprospiraceae bacterium]